MINYTLTLDATRKVPNNRAYITEKQREQSGSITLGLEKRCFDVSFHIEVSCLKPNNIRKTHYNPHSFNVKNIIFHTTNLHYLDIHNSTLLSQACPEDALNPLNNELRFIFDGLPSDKNLKPSLAQQAQTTTFHPVSNL